MAVWIFERSLTTYSMREVEDEAARLRRFDLPPIVVPV